MLGNFDYSSISGEGRVFNSVFLLFLKKFVVLLWQKTSHCKLLYMKPQISSPTKINKIQFDSIRMAIT